MILDIDILVYLSSLPICQSILVFYRYVHMLQLEFLIGVLFTCSATLYSAQALYQIKRANL